ncbi:MAG: ABC transporter substrate-binding protein [Rhodospirillaceae bacterium]|nr:ABC transporter substrate-binding protein [Rhodospirillaceae bacterium]
MNKFLLMIWICCVAPAAGAATLRVAVDALPPSMGNPFRSSLAPTVYATGAIFDALTKFDTDAKLQPALAERWENIDPLTWRFHLRAGVRFSNGAPFTSDAVVNAVDYLINGASASLEGLKRELNILKSARAVDELTVDIVTLEPVPLFPRYASALMIPEPAQWRALGRDGFAKQPVGTGPFKAEAITASRWKLSAYRESWRAPKVDALEILMLPDTATRVQALEAGRVDIALVLGADNIGSVEAAGGRMESGMVSSVYGLTLITTRGGPLADVRVRRAINMGVNRERIVSGLMAGRTTPASQPAARAALGYDPTIPQYPYDPAAAKKLLAEAGYPAGLKFVLDAPLGASAGDTSVFQQVQSDLRAIGVDMQINTLAPTMYLNKIAQTDFDGDAFPIAWPSWPILDVWRAFQIHSCLRPVPWFCDQSLMPKLTAALSEWDEAKAIALRQEVGRAYHEAAPAIFLYELPLFVGLGKNVRTYGMFSNLIAYDKIELDP